MSLKTLNKLLFIGVIIVWVFVLYIKSHNVDYTKIAQVISSVLPASSVVEKPSDSPEWSLLLTGDVIPARSVNAQMTTRNDFGWALTEIDGTLKNADLTVINLESPLLTNCPVTNEGMKFCGDARFTKALADSGIDIANLANNHSLNYGWEGLAETEKHLADVGIDTTGYFSSQSNTATMKTCNNNIYCSKFTVKEIKGNRIGFLGYNAVGQTIDRELVKQQIETADKLVDVLVVSVHWGKEYEPNPVADLSLAPDDPKELGKLFINWGADVVVGNHPHVVQGIEWVGGKPVFYALGNTVFDQEWSAETKIGYLAKLHFSGDQINKDQIEIIPIGIRNYGQAYPLEGNEKENILSKLGY